MRDGPCLKVSGVTYNRWYVQWLGILIQFTDGSNGHFRHVHGEATLQAWGLRSRGRWQLRRIVGHVGATVPERGARSSVAFTGDARRVSGPELVKTSCQGVVVKRHSALSCSSR